jgi:hypothetical protein
MTSSGILDDNGRTHREQFGRTAHHNRRREKRAPRSRVVPVPVAFPAVVTAFVEYTRQAAILFPPDPNALQAATGTAI